MATALSPVPDFGDVVQRTALVRLFESRAPSLTVICAPAGYGKSVLAGQFARSSRFEAVHWASFEGSVVAGDGFVAQLSQTLAVRDLADSAGVATTLPIAPLTRADALLLLRDELVSYRHTALCLVVDGLDAVDTLSELAELVRLLRDCTSSASRVIVTCRGLRSGDGSGKQRLWFVDDRDLRFRAPEIAELLIAVGDAKPDALLVARLMEQSAGQPALLDLIVRHPGLLEEAWNGIPQDLYWYLESLVGDLTNAEISTLYAAALMGEGTVDELTALASVSLSQLAHISCAVPMLNVATHEGIGHGHFRVHALLEDVLSDCIVRRVDEVELATVRSALCEVLRARGDYRRIFSILLRHGTTEERVESMESIGSALLRAVGPAGMRHLLDLVPAHEIAARSTLLLLLSVVLREQEQLREALDKAVLARSIADCEQNWSVYVDASLTIARIALDLGDLASMETALRPLLQSRRHDVGLDSRCLISAYLALVDSQAGRLASAMHHVDTVTELLERLDPSSEAAVFAMNCLLAVRGIAMGDWACCVELLRGMPRRKGLTPVQSLLLRANYAASLLELGRLDQAERELGRVIGEMEESGLRQMRAYALGTASGIVATKGDSDEALRVHGVSCALLSEMEDGLGMLSEQAYWAMTARGCGLGHLSLEAAESAVAAVGSSRGQVSLMAGLAQVEVAASFLSLGDTASAISRIEQVRPLFAVAEAKYHLLRADMVLAEAARVGGDFTGAVERIRAHREYILTESSNWQIAMYIRAFPGLLPVVASGVGTAELPVHIIRMIAEPYADVALRAAKKHLVAARYRELARRFDHAASPEALEAEGRPTAPCYVRLFGGLEVTTEYGVVSESSWSKRKARLMFAMLAARRGQEIPRDVLLERLWPEMDEERARNNYYVMWSAMKQALACGGKAGLAAKYVGNAGGLCRVTPLVRSDIDDFEDALRSLLAAEGAGHGSGVLAAAQEISDLYRGELLPGDLYDDWFIDMRDRYRHDFCDAMLSAAVVAERSGDFARAITFVRRALAYDPWREDLYQTAIRCQMQAGQRSGAIELYFSCRNRLSDDLGIDPSFETQRLYENVLAMEDAPVAESPNRSGE